MPFQTESGLVVITAGLRCVKVAAHLQMQIKVFVLAHGRVDQLCSVLQVYQLISYHSVMSGCVSPKDDSALTISCVCCNPAGFHTAAA